MARNWDAEMASIVKECVKKANPAKATEVYLKEDMMAEAMKLLESLDNLELFETFRTRLSRRYPSRYFAAYGPKIIEEARFKKSRKHYDRIQRHLINLKAIPSSGTKYADVENTIRSENSTKRALLKMIDEIE